jgi:hemerythrin-like domain-containing protein
MKPFGPLTHEHRLIERMMKLTRDELTRIKQCGEINADFVAAIIDFFGDYADRLHHGKEEDILFLPLSERNLSDEHRQLLDELLAEHSLGRDLIERMRQAHQQLTTGGAQAVEQLRQPMQHLMDMYAGHIDKEDNRFFRSVMKYFSEDEQEEMLEAFEEFDRKVMHEKYTELTEHWENDLACQ